MVNYSEALRLQRELNGLSQSELARQTGIKHANISYWENGGKEPGISFCIKLADYYGISLDELVGRDYERTTKINNQIRDNHGNITINQR